MVERIRCKNLEMFTPQSTSVLSLKYRISQLTSEIEKGHKREKKLAYKLSKAEMLIKQVMG